MPIPVSDSRSNPNDQIAHAAEVLKRSPRWMRLFRAIYAGKSPVKTVGHLMKATKQSRVAVLQDGGVLAGQQLVHKRKVDGEMAYEKDAFYATNRNKILRLAANPQSLKAFPTKLSPKASGGVIQIRGSAKGARIQITEVTCDDFDQFAKIRRVRTAPPRSLTEAEFKAGIQRLIGETGKFQDWGGEKNDLYTSKLRYRGQRRAVAFAFKGPGTSGILTPKKLGKNANQIQRLFSSPAEVFIIQYHGQIDADVVEQMKLFAIANSVKDGKRIWYGVIDGDDTNRLLAAYPHQFKSKSK